MKTLRESYDLLPADQLIRQVNDGSFIELSVFKCTVGMRRNDGGNRHKFEILQETRPSLCVVLLTLCDIVQQATGLRQAWIDHDAFPG